MINLVVASNNANMLVDVPFSEVFRHKRTTPNRSTCDVDQNIMRLELTVRHCGVRIVRDKGNIIEVEARRNEYSDYVSAEYLHLSNQQLLHWE